LPYFEACKAMAAYRLGHFQDAIEWADKAVKIPGADALAKAKAFAILAMSNWRLGQTSEARAALAKGNSLAPAPAADSDVVDIGESWVAWLQARITLDEAVSMIEPPPVPGGA
jgi:tetratricopeptide (TPR) repeat protein